MLRAVSLASEIRCSDSESSAFSFNETPKFCSRRKERNADKRNSRGAVTFFREAESSLGQFAMDNSSLRCNNSPASRGMGTKRGEQSLAPVKT